MPRWTPGEAVIEQMLAAGELETISKSAADGSAVLGQAERRLTTAEVFFGRLARRGGRPLRPASKAIYLRCYGCRMTTVAVRDLRNNTAEVIQEARDGQTVILTSRGQPIAQIVPLGSRRRKYLTPTEVSRIPQADSALKDDVAALADDIASLGPIQ